MVAVCPRKVWCFLVGKGVSSEKISWQCPNIQKQKMSRRTLITASMLYDLVVCPHRPTQDLFEDPARRDKVSPFIQLLWERGTCFEQEVMSSVREPVLDLSSFASDEKEQRTKAAMEQRVPLIYGGRIHVNDLLGEPDLLRLEGVGYIPGDIKSGSGREGGDEEDHRLKTRYAVQLALYVDVLEQLRRSSGRRGFIWDIHHEEVAYDFMIPQGPRNPQTLWEEYQNCLTQIRSILALKGGTRPAYGSVCKNCHWYSACLKEVQATDDLTLIPELGRSRRESLLTHVRTVTELSKSDIGLFIQGKKTVFPSVGPSMLAKFYRRACLLREPNPQPQLLEPIILPTAPIELFFDIETDPLRDRCYLHGFVERRNRENSSERFVAFFADTPTEEAEEQAFADAWAYVQSVQPCVTYYYSKYERTFWRKLRARYPHVCTEIELEAFFDPNRTIDLYNDIVKNKTDWPTLDYSIKTLAKYLGFKWRDSHPSGAASIEWFYRWVETKDSAVKQRILEYNEDDCRATRVLLDGLRRLKCD